MSNRILCDLDGVVIDFVGALCERLNEMADLPNSRGWKESDFVEYFCEKTMPPSLRPWFEESMNDGSICIRRELYPGARRFVYDLARYPTPVEFLTAGGPSDWNLNTRKFIARTWPTARVHFASPQDKSGYEGVTLIEDRVDTAEDWAERQGKTAILLDRPWNSGAILSSRVERARNYAHATRLVGDLLK